MKMKSNATLTIRLPQDSKAKIWNIAKATKSTPSKVIRAILESNFNDAA